MARSHDSMVNPPIEMLLDRVDSKFALVTMAARRARQINSYFNHLGDSNGFEEIAADKIIIRPIAPPAEAATS
jgi:DNA-directed RNA polymerase subunit omega